MSLKELLVPAYGGSLYKETQQLQNVLCKVACSKNHMIFITRCLHHGITPRFLRTACPIKTKYADLVAKDYRKKLLKCAKKDTSSRFFKQSRLATQLKSSICNQVTVEHYDIITRVTESCRENKFLSEKSKLKRKFDLLQEEKNRKSTMLQTNKVKNCVLNLVNDTLPVDENDVLNLGPKFAINPTRIPYMEIITTAEMKALSLEREDKHTVAEQLRQDILNVLSTAKPPKPNLDRNQRNAIKRMQENEEIDIYPYDKGSGFVRVLRTDAIAKIENEIGTTVKLTKDPTKNIITKFQRLLNNINKEINIPNKLYRDMYPSDGIPPRLYGTIKAHKPNKNYPARTIVSTIGTPSYKVSEYLVKIIQPTLNNEATIKNSASFVEEAKQWNISPREIQVSFDVVAMYPSVPIRKAICVIMDMLKTDYENVKTRTVLNLQHIKSLMELCLENSYFLWNNEIRKLVDSGPIGLSLMVVVAEGFLQSIEKRAFIIAKLPANSVCPITHKRYVDDTHDRFSTRRKCDKFLEILNSIEPKIQFEAEYEDDNKTLHFLDTTIINNGKGKYEFTIHRKNAITNVQLKPHSCHDDKIKYGVFKGFIHRAKAICSDHFLGEELEFLIAVFVQNGYDETKLRSIISNYNSAESKEGSEPKKYVSLPFIPNISKKIKNVFLKAGFTVMFKSGRNLASVLTSRNKPKLPKNSYPGVYRVPCKCHSNYIGHTGKKVLSRGKEHEKAVFSGNWGDSALAEHAKNCQEGINWEEFTTLSTQPYYYRRAIMEALEIQREEVCHQDHAIINDRSGLYVTTDSWKPLFRKIGSQTNQ